MEKNGKVLMQKYEFGKLLGQGTFAKVYYARNVESGQSVAIKVIDKEKVLKVGLIDQTKREISVMGLVKHPNVIELYEVMATKTKIYLSIEYAKGGELFHKIAKGKLDENTARKYFQQLISAVEFSHRKGIFHRDLKLENLLLDENGALKITDFGLCALAESKRQDGLLHTTCGTPAYVAPEVISRKGYDGAKADTWSCGVILFVLLAGFLPFQDANVMNMYRMISKAQYKFPCWFTPDVRKLLSKILDPNPSSRISITKIMNNPWFQKGVIPKRSNPILTVPVSVGLKEFVKPLNLNAFDIISLSTGFDLSGMFTQNEEKKDMKFTCKESASGIVSKLEEIARNLRLRISKKDGGFLKMESEEFCIDAEIFEFSPLFLLVEVKTSGDGLEFQKMMKSDFRPALEGIVWAWHA